MADSWEDLDDSVLDEELEMLEAMYSAEYTKLEDRKFRLSLSAEGKSGSVPCTFECEIPDDYPATCPMSTVSLDIKDHLAQKRLERAIEGQLHAFSEEHKGATCLTGLVDMLAEAIRDIDAIGPADDSTCTPKSTPGFKPRAENSFDECDVAPLCGNAIEEEPLFDFVKYPPPGDIVGAECKYEKRFQGMQAFSSRAFTFSSSGIGGYRTTDGSCVTMGNPSSYHGKWGLLGDGPLTYAELEVGMVRPGHHLELMLGVTATDPDKIDLQYMHGIADTVMVALDAQAPWLSLGYQDGQMFSLSDMPPERSDWLKPGDVLGVWHSSGELRLLRNGQPLLRLRTELGKQVTLMVLLMGRVVQLKMNVPKEKPAVSFKSVELQGPKRLDALDWMQSDDCANLRPLW